MLVSKVTEVHFWKWQNCSVNYGIVSETRERRLRWIPRQVAVRDQASKNPSICCFIVCTNQKIKMMNWPRGTTLEVRQYHKTFQVVEGFRVLPTIMAGTSGKSWTEGFFITFVLRFKCNFRTVWRFMVASNYTHHKNQATSKSESRNKGCAQNYSSNATWTWVPPESL